MDWQTFRGRYAELDDIGDSPGAAQIRAANKCRGVVEAVRRMCELDKAGPAVARLQAVKCTLAPERRVREVIGSVENGVLIVKMGWDTDMDNARRVLVNVVSSPAGGTIAESKEVPKIDAKIDVQIDDINETCKRKVTGAIDWASFKGNYRGAAAAGPTAIEPMWEVLRTGVLQLCRKGDRGEVQQFASRVKSLALSYDASLRKGGVRYELDGAGTLRLRVNSDANLGGIELDFDIFWGKTVNRPPRIREPGRNAQCGLTIYKGNQVLCTICSNHPSDIPERGGKLVDDPTIQGGKKREGPCWRDYRLAPKKR
jgi:hypothetical protein